MKKCDLETGMVLVCRNNKKFVVINESIGVHENGWFNLHNYEEDLKCKDPYSDDYDIMKVYDIGLNVNLFNHIMNYENLTTQLIWKRIEIKEVVDDNGRTYEIPEDVLEKYIV